MHWLLAVSSPCHLIALPRAASTVPSLLPFSTSPFCSPVPFLPSLWRFLATTFWMPPCSLSTLLDASALAFQPFWMHPCPLSATSAHCLPAMTSIVRRMACAHVLMSDGWVHRLAALAACETTSSTTRPKSSSEARRANASSSSFERPSRQAALERPRERPTQRTSWRACTSTTSGQCTSHAHGGWRLCPARRAARTGLGCVWEGIRWVSG